MEYRINRKTGDKVKTQVEWMLQEQGVVKHIGLSSHTPALIQRVLDEAPVDMLMFSVNPGYDYQKGELAKGSMDERSAVYHHCVAEGIGISVMKPFSGG